MGNTLTVEKAGSILTVTLNRPKSFNALNNELSDELLTAITNASEDKSVRVVIITGSGKAFCAGGDLQYFMNCPSPKNEAFGKLLHGLNRIIMDIRNMPKPVIAAINGVASGAGFSIATACDLRIASADAKFKQAYTSIGLVPDGGWTITVARQIGMAKTSELLLLDPVLSAEEALTLGLLNKVVPSSELLEQANELARQASAKSITAFASAKALINQSLGFGLAEQLEAERKGVMNASETSDYVEGISAFMEKRKPKFN